MKPRLLTFLQRIFGWRLWVSFVLLVLALVELIIAIMDVVLKGGVVAVDLFIGLVAVALVALPMLALLQYLLNHIAKAQQRKLEDSAHHANARLNLVLENAQMVVWDLDLAKDVMRIDDDTLGLLGMSTSNAPHNIHSLMQRIHPDDRANFAQHFQAALEAAAPPFSVEYRVAQKGGDWGWVHSTGRVIQRDAAGNPLTVVGSTTNINARKQAEELLLEQQSILAEREEQFRSIFTQANDGILLIDPETLGFVEFNEVACNNLGYSREEFSRFNLESIQAEMNRTQLVEKAHSLKMQGAVQFETLHRHKDGSLRNVWVSCRAISLRGRDYVISTSTDITERKRAEQALLASKELARSLAQMLRLLCDNVPDMIWAKDLNKCFIFANKAICAQLLNATDTDEPVGKDDMFFAQRERNSHPDDPHWHTFGELCQDSDKITLELGKASRFDEFGNVQGKFLFLDVYKAPFVNDKGEVIGVVGSARDVTAQKSAEEKLLLASAILENSSEAMFVTDEEGRIVDTNPAFAKLTGYTEEEVLGKRPSIFSSGRHGADFYHQMWEGINRTGRWEGEIWNKRKNGEIYPEWLVINTVYHEDGSVNRRVAMFVDNTERHQVLEQLRNTADALVKANAQIEEERARLAERVEDRTAQLQYANKAKDSFLATMSHEIRTPLGGLLGMMELLGLSRLDKEQSDMLAAARKSGNSLLRIVDDILDWSKIEAKKLVLAPRSASLSELLKGVIDTYTQLASDKGITLKLETDAMLDELYIFDPLRLSQILNNFTSNAIKFTERGAVQIGVERVAQHKGYDTVRFSVRDNGIGMDKEQQSRLFQHYEQATADTARMYGGTGLGLSICRSLAELLEGTIAVDSTPGVGSTFSFTLNLPHTDASDGKISAQQDKAKPDATDALPLAASGKRIAVLIVDDHPLNRMLLKQQLDLLGLHVDAAADGKEALVLWQTSHFDLIISDCHMPEMDGYELTRQIRDTERYAGAPHVPIIAWTANVLTEEAERCRAAGMDDMLTKPTELAELRATLLKWLVKAGVIDMSAVREMESKASEPEAKKIAVLDIDVLKKVSVRQDAQIEMLYTFNECNRSDVTNLLDTLHKGNPDTVARAAHRIKGASRMVGALELESVCLSIEQAAKQGDMQAARAVADMRLDGAVKRLEEAILVLLTGGGI